MPGRNWDEIPQETWEDIRIHFEEAGDIYLEFNYVGRNNVHYQYPPEQIDFEDFLDIYDEAKELDQEFEITSG